jgi:hypothetical protein
MDYQFGAQETAARLYQTMRLLSPMRYGLVPAPSSSPARGLVPQTLWLLSLSVKPNNLDLSSNRLMRRQPHNHL